MRGTKDNDHPVAASDVDFSVSSDGNSGASFGYAIVWWRPKSGLGIDTNGRQFKP